MFQNASGCLEQKQADHTYTPEVRSSSGPASLHPGQSIKKKHRGINTRPVAKIGYPSISVFATPPGRHLIGQRRPPPDDGHISTGRPDFGYSTPKRNPIIIPHYPKMAGLFDHIGPTAHHASSEFHPSSYLCYRRRRARTICLYVWFSRRQTIASSLPLSNQNLSIALSLSFQPNATSAQQQYIETGS